MREVGGNCVAPYACSPWKTHLTPSCTRFWLQSGSPQPVRHSHRHRRGPIGPLNPEQVAKLLSELDVVQRNIYIMSEIMTETEPGKETTEDVELLDVSREVGGEGVRKWKKREEK